MTWKTQDVIDRAYEFANGVYRRPRTGVAVDVKGKYDHIDRDALSKLSEVFAASFFYDDPIDRIDWNSTRKDKGFDFVIDQGGEWPDHADVKNSGSGDRAKYLLVSDHQFQNRKYSPDLLIGTTSKPRIETVDDLDSFQMKGWINYKVFKKKSVVFPNTGRGMSLEYYALGNISELAKSERVVCWSSEHGPGYIA